MNWKNLLLSSFLIVSLLLLNQVVVVSASYANVNVSEAKEMIESNPDLVILDVRTQEEYDEGHLENTVLIPVSELESRLDELDSEKVTLVYCRSGGRSATASQILVDNGFSSVYNMLGGITDWRNARYWIEIFHKGDLIIDGTQTYVIENCTFVQTGNTYIREYGKLVISNARFIANFSYPEQYDFSIEDHGSLEIKNTEMISYAEVDAWTHEDTSVTFENASVDFWWVQVRGTAAVINSTLYYFQLTSPSKTSIINSIVDFILFEFNEPYRITIDDLRPGFYKSWELRFGPSHVLTLENTVVWHWWVNVCGSSIVTVTDSILDGAGLGFHDHSEVTIENLKPGTHSFWSLRTNESIQDVDCEFTIENTTVYVWSIGVWGDSVVNIYNTTANIHPIDRGKVYVENSEVQYFHIRHNAEAVITNSTMSGGLMFIHFQGNMFLNNTRVEIGWYFVHNSDFYMSGDLTLDPREFELSYILSNATRNYDVLVKDNTDNTIVNVELTLFDRNDTVVWNGTTDSLGKANFNLTFTDNNHTDTLRLEVSNEECYSTTKSISFLSDTPISIVLLQKPIGDLNEDRKVDIRDITIVAMAFGSTPGDENWNLTADLNNDEVIDIRDITIVALEFGKTV